jgi:putative MATE family efflux protein
MRALSKEEQYKKMTASSIPSLITSLAIPTIISMLVTSIYNLADTYFVSELGTSASGAVGVVFGLMAVLQAFGFMFGHGAGSHIARHIGAKDVEGARVYSADSFYLSLLTGTVIAVLGLCFLDPFMRLLGATETILPYARIYGICILIAGPAFTASCVLNNILRYEGKAFYAMIGLTSGGILNIFGDALLMKVYHLGIAGAGISTMVTQYLSLIILMIPYLRGQTQSSLHPKYMSLKKEIVGGIIAVGFPSLMRQGLNAVSTMVLNGAAGQFGDAAVAAVSIVNRIMNFLFAISIGIGQGFQPVSAFNYGAGKYSRVRAGFQFSLRLSEILMVICGLIGFLSAEPLVAVFRDDPEVIAIGTSAMRIRAVSLVFLPMSVLGNMLFQSIGRAKTASLLAALRSGLILIPSILILTKLFGLRGLEWSQGVSDSLASLLSLPFCHVFLRELPPDKEKE